MELKLISQTQLILSENLENPASQTLLIRKPSCLNPMRELKKKMGASLVLEVECEWQEERKKWKIRTVLAQMALKMLNVLP